MLIFHFGAMNSGKSAKILQMAYQLDGKLSFGLYTCEHKSTIDSRVGIERSCEHITELFSRTINRFKKVLLIDEAQWLTKEQVVELRKWVDENNVTVHCFGLRTNTNGDFFEGSAALFQLSDKQVNMTSYCSHCSHLAILHNKVEGTGKDGFEAVCYKHFKEK